VTITRGCAVFGRPLETASTGSVLKAMHMAGMMLDRKEGGMNEVVHVSGVPPV
jgi:hypothetical protein